MSTFVEALSFLCQVIGAGFIIGLFLAIPILMVRFALRLTDR